MLKRFVHAIAHHIGCHVLGGSFESTFNWKLQEFRCNECGHRHVWKPKDIVS
jgi:hypothetical protein